VRAAFIETLCTLASERPDLVLLCGDLGFSVLGRYAQRFPDRYYNVGVAEQNMVGLAAGLARAGKTVVTYSIANFATVRCLEQIRNDVCYHDAPVVVVSVGSGFSYGAQGYSHHGIEDMAFTRVLPNIAVVSPGDAAETRWAVRSLIERGGPASLRLGKGSEPVVHQTEVAVPFGKAISVYPDGRDVTFVSTGAVLPAVVAAANELRGRGIDAGVLSVPVVAPLDEPRIERAARTSRLIISVEEHCVKGGLGGATAEVLAELETPRARLLRVGVWPTATSAAHDQRSLRAIHGLDAGSLVARAIRELCLDTRVP
jgi:transketolase